jgi:hypothetical protein
MNPLHRLVRAVFYRVRTVSVRDCVHYCGFRYGRDEFNPYEQYVRGLLSGAPRAALREDLRDFLVHFRPKNLGEALSVPLEHAPPLWQLPWRRLGALTPRGWRATAAEIPDVLTHFSDQGVPEQRILEEYGLLEGAWDAIRRDGYQPRQHSFIRVFELQGEIRSAYLVADGNHRLSCLGAMGQTEVDVILAPARTARRRRSASWPAVRGGQIGEADALRIFDAYFRGNPLPHRAPVPATVISTGR